MVNRRQVSRVRPRRRNVYRGFVPLAQSLARTAFQAARRYASGGRGGSSVRGRTYEPRMGSMKVGGRRYPVNRLVETVKKPMFTKGYAGPKFKKGSKPRGDLYKKLGSEAVFEFGSVSTDTEVVGVGHHSAPLMEVWRSYWRAVWRALMKKFGVDFNSWSQEFSQFMSIAPKFVLSYHTAPDTTVTQFAYTNAVPIGTYLTHYQWANNIANDLYNTIGTVPGAEDNFMPVACEIQFDSNPTILSIPARLELHNSYFHLSSGSTMVLQNRTAGAAATDDQTTDITNNPLIGRSYDFIGNQLRSRSGTQVDGTATADSQSGVIIGSVATTDPIAPGTFKKMNSASALMYCKATKRCSLSPGQIRRSSLYKTQVIKTQTLMKMLLTWLINSTAFGTPPVCRVGLGESRVFQFEKLCDTRSGTESIDVGYEINVKIKSYLSFRTAETERMAIKLT